MKFTIKHESRGRMRVHMEQYRMTYEQADTLLYVIHNHRNVTFVKVYDRTADAVIEYVGDREQIIELLRHFHYESANVPQTVIKTSGRELNNSYQENLSEVLSGITVKAPAAFANQDSAYYWTICKVYWNWA